MPVVSSFFVELLHHSDKHVFDGDKHRNMMGSLQFLAQQAWAEITPAINFLAQISQINTVLDVV